MILLVKITVSFFFSFNQDNSNIHPPQGPLGEAPKEGKK